MRIFLYLTREIYANFLGVLTILLFIFLSGRLVKHLASAATGQFPSDIIFSIMLYRLPGFLEILLPLALFLGLMLAFGRLYVESEMIVLQACGMSKRRLIFLTQWACLPVMLLFALISLYLTPLGFIKYQKLWENPANHMSFSTVVSGSFKKIGSDGMMIYAGSLNNDKTLIGDVFAVIGNKKRGEEGQLNIIKAKNARLVYGQHGNQYIELADGVRVKSGDSDLDYSVSRFDQFGHLIGHDQHISKDVNSIDAMTTGVLMRSSDVKARARFQWRIGLPFMIPVIAIIGLAFSETTHRKGRYIKLLPGILIYFIYFGLITALFSFMESGKIPDYIGLWPVHGVFLCVGLLIFYWTDIQLLWKKRLASQ